MDLEAVRGRMRAVWSEGDYAQLAPMLVPAARALVDACAVSAGQEVLDVAAGNGNLAVLAAAEGASVVACDITPSQVELGRARSASEGVEVEWVVADAEELPFEEARFDCVASVFGAMFAPRARVAAEEMFRVVRPGGTVGMANWTAEGFQGQLFAIANRYAPPAAEGVPPAAEWGDEETVRSRLEGLARSIELERRMLRWEFESAEAMVSFFEANAGPAVMARRALPPDRHAAMVEEQRDLVRRHNSAESSVVIDAEYLVVVARSRG